MYKVDNAIIMAAGFASRFVPLSFEIPKGLIKVRGEVLIERQIKQLKSAGIEDIIIVTGHLAEQFEYLIEKFNVRIINNKEYSTRNNHSSIYCVKDYIKNSYICSCDDYFPINPYEQYVEDSYYCALFSKGETQEWGTELDNNDKILKSKPGGFNQWYLIGHAFLSEDFSKEYLRILEEDYNKEEIKSLLWEEVYLNHIDELTLKIKKYDKDSVIEFDTLDELRLFDSSYINNSTSTILKNIAAKLSCSEKELKNFKPYKNSSLTIGFHFSYNNLEYLYNNKNKTIEVINLQS